MLKNNWRSLLAFFVVIAMIQAVGSSVTMPEIDGWYASLQKPEFNPPNWIFGPMWTALYILIAISGWMVWCKLPGSFNDRILSRAMLTYAWQLAANFMWSMFFFRMRDPELALADILILLGLIGLNIYRFHGISRTAAYMLVPYFLWVSFAAVLNYNIVILN